MATKKLKKVIINGESYNLPNNTDYVDLSTNQTVAGTKTFSTSPVVPSKTGAAANSGTAIATEAQVYLKQDKLTAGANITIAADGYTISATDTTYSTVTKSDMDTGTGITAGVVTAKDLSDFVNGKLSNTYTYKGTKADYDSLPTTGNVVGDVWNVTAAHTTDPKFPAGTNVAWDGTGWDVLGGIFDVSSFVDTSSNQTVGGTKTFSTSPVVPSKTAAATNTGTAIATEAQVYTVASGLSTLDGNVVKLSGDQSIAGTKTFTTSPVVPSKTADATNTGTAIATEAQVYKKLDSSDLGNATISFYQGISSTATGTLTTNQSSNGTLTFHDNVVKTQTEYDNLPNTKATDGNSYWIYESVA